MGGQRRAALAGALAILIAAPAAAQDGPEPIAVDYDAPTTCPDRAAFFGEVTARTSRARAAAAGENARVLRVRIERRADLYSGRLTIVEGSTTSTPREVSGVSCGEVVGALGLVAALAVDPAASVAPRPAPSAGATPAATTSDAPPKPPASASTARDTPPPPKPTEDKPPTPPPAQPTEPDPLRFAAGAGAEAASLAGPVFALRIFGEVSLGGRTFDPSLRLAGTRTLTVEEGARVGSAKLTWTHGALEGCPLKFAIGAGFALRPCAAFVLGVLHAEGSGVEATQTRTRPWTSAGAHLRLVWAPARFFSIEAEGGGAAPLLRESFFFGPDIPVYEAAGIVGFARLAAAVRFP